ncbi:serine/arginine repetitive matrix protein 1-like [Procambarus clarkii]|uniref:serine/arginine repetitive matrix protein 1-like n=1 Tax=Procambarus clarkii TaxID=6728 RepID=UPI003743A628
MEGLPGNFVLPSRRSPEAFSRRKPKMRKAKNLRKDGTEPREELNPSSNRTQREEKKTPLFAAVSPAHDGKSRRGPMEPKAPKSTPPHPREPLLQALGPNRPPKPRDQEKPEAAERARREGGHWSDPGAMAGGTGSNVSIATPDGSTPETARVSETSKPRPDPETLRRLGAGSRGGGGRPNEPPQGKNEGAWTESRTKRPTPPSPSPYRQSRAALGHPGKRQPEHVAIT